MADIAAIRAELADRLATMLGDTGQASAYWSESAVPPTLQVRGISDTTYDLTFQRGGDTFSMVIEGLAAGLDHDSQITVDQWLDTTGATSVKEAIETERPAPVTLGGLVAGCRVAGTTGVRKFRLPNGTEVVGAEWTLEITT